MSKMSAFKTFLLKYVVLNILRIYIPTYINYIVYNNENKVIGTFTEIVHKSVFFFNTAENDNFI